LGRHTEFRALDHLTIEERAAVLGNLLRNHPELRNEADDLAAEQLRDVDQESVAVEVMNAYLDQSFLDVGSRAGRQPGRGYVHETEAQWELLTETLEPFERDIARLARAGFERAAGTLARGVFEGLVRLRTIADEETLIGWGGALEDHTADLTASVLATCRSWGVELPAASAASGR
jgi:hypothetical protein